MIQQTDDPSARKLHHLFSSAQTQCSAPPAVPTPTQAHKNKQTKQMEKDGHIHYGLSSSLTNQDRNDLSNSTFQMTDPAGLLSSANHFNACL